ncbi:ABC transporter substrate-binding protein [Ferrovibrio sp.]|uniref:ABC transporter substrate-binding protein n=1 Tax=Ferrovibrio sp. TaxID=1917215 RepID=UPI0025BB6AEA|nr:ABC transporter substrate-binding protein [Ferrovibrio sp.]
MRHILRAALLIGLAAPVLCFSGSSYAQGKSDIVVGTITDLSGPAAVYGHAVVNAMRLRFDAVNAAGGIRGRKLKLVVEDHQFQVPRAVQATSKLLRLDHAQVFVGSLGTAQVQAVLPQLRAAGVANLFPMAASRDLVHAPDAISWISGSLYYDQIRAGVKWMVETQAKQAVCVMAQGTDYGEEVQQAVKDELARHGQSVKMVVTHRPIDTDFSAPVQRLRNAGCDLVVLATLLRDTILPMASAKTAGWNVDFLGPSTTHDYLLAQAPGGATQGLYSVSSIALPDRAAAPAGVVAWMDAYKARFNTEPNAAAIYGATIADLAVLALDRAGGDAGMAKLTRSIASIRGWRDLFGGTLQSFGDGGRQGTRQAYVYQLRGPHYERLTEAVGY